MHDLKCMCMQTRPQISVPSKRGGTTTQMVHPYPCGTMLGPGFEPGTFSVVREHSIHLTTAPLFFYVKGCLFLCSRPAKSRRRQRQAPRGSNLPRARPRPRVRARPRANAEPSATVVIKSSKTQKMEQSFHGQEFEECLYFFRGISTLKTVDLENVQDGVEFFTLP